MSTAAKDKRVCIIVFMLLFIAAGIFTLANVKNYLISRETRELESMNIIYNNVYIRGEFVGGLTPQQALDRMNKYINVDYSKDKKLIFRLSTTGYTKEFTYPELGMGFDVEKAVNEAYGFGRNNDGSAKRADIAELDVGGKYIDAENKYSIEYDVQAESNGIDTVTECLSTIEYEVNEQLLSSGKTMDVERTAKEAEQMLMVNEYDALIYIATK